MVDTDLIKDGLRDLLPPGAGPKNDRQRYDWTISLTLLGVIIVGGAHIAQACGFLVWLGLGGFAMADDVKHQQATLTSIQLSQLNRDMRDAKRQICLAQQQRNQAALTSWSVQLQTARGTYFSITNSWPEVQSCEELLVAGPSG